MLWIEQLPKKSVPSFGFRRVTSISSYTSHPNCGIALAPCATTNRKCSVWATEGFAVMRLFVLCALAIGVGILLLIGFLVTAQELLSESLFGVPQEPGEETGRRHMDEGRSTSSSSTPAG